MKEGYKQTEIGIVPQDWKVVELGELVEITSGESPSKFQFSDTGIPYFKVEQLNNGSKFADKTPFFVNSLKTVAAHSVVFPKRGASIFHNKVRIFASASFMDTNLMAVTPVSDLNAEFLFYQLSYLGLSKIADTTSVPQINNKHIVPFKISLPIPKEQKAIAAVLSDVDGLIASLEALIAKKRALKIATMQQLLVGKTRLDGFGFGKSVRKTELGEIPEDWLTYKISDEFIIYAGGDVPKDSFSKVKSEEFPIPIFANAIQKKGLYGYTAKERSKADSLTITARGYLGHAEYREELYFPIVRLLVLEPNGKLDARYSTYAINDRVEFAIESTGVPQLTAPQVGNYKLAAPSNLEEQKAIAEVIHSFEQDIAVVVSRLTKTKALKQGMMQELLTGRTRLV